MQSFQALPKGPGCRWAQFSPPRKAPSLDGKLASLKSQCGSPSQESDQIAANAVPDLTEDHSSVLSNSRGSCDVPPASLSDVDSSAFVSAPEQHSPDVQATIPTGPVSHGLQLQPELAHSPDYIVPLDASGEADVLSMTQSRPLTLTDGRLLSLTLQSLAFRAITVVRWLQRRANPSDKTIANIGWIVACASTSVSFIALSPAFRGQDSSERALRIAEWTAEKDFNENCHERVSTDPSSRQLYLMTFSYHKE